jgi:hypothetical protein
VGDALLSLIMTTRLLLLTLYAGANLVGHTNANALGHTNFSSADDAILYGLTTWGRETNGLQFGACLPNFSKPRPGEEKFQVRTYVFNIGVAARTGLLLPPHGYRLDMELRSKGGRAVSRTAEGDALCRRLLWTPLAQFNPASVRAGTARAYERPFDLLRCFKIGQSGTYVFSAKPTLNQALQNGQVPLDLPAVSLEFTVTQSDLSPSEGGTSATLYVVGVLACVAGTSWLVWRRRSRVRRHPGSDIAPVDI